MYKQLGPATPFVIPLTIFVFYYIYRILTSCCPGGKKTVLDDDVLYQSLEAFFKSLRPKRREYWLREEVWRKKVLDIPKLSEEAFTRLATYKDEGKKSGRPKLQGVHNYDILANPEYTNLYHYIEVVAPARTQYVISEYQNKDMRLKQVDLVRLVCDLAYMSEERAKKMDFSVEYLCNEEKIRAHKTI